jgi:hypothetical protein
VSTVNNVAFLIIAALAVLAIAALVVWTTRRRRSAELRQRFGPEYERMVKGARDRIEAEKELRAREERVEALEIRPLEPAVCDRYAGRWREVQAMFVDDPGGAVEQADTLIGEVLRARGYPVGDFEQRAADISVNHPQVVDHYRTAHSIAVRRRTGEGATEQLRQAFVHYRALFADLLETPDRDGTGTADRGASAPEARLVEREAAAADPATEARREEVAGATGTTPPLVEQVPAATVAERAARADRQHSTTAAAETEAPVDPARRA